MPTVNIIGAGRVGRTFLRLLGSQVQDVASATRASADLAVREAEHGHATDLDAMRPADIWFLTVPDTQIARAARTLAQTQAEPSIALHCSGFHTANEMVPLGSKGWHLASAHPNLSFADPSAAALGFEGTPVGLEGDEFAVQIADDLFGSLGAVTFIIPSEQKALYHAGAVFSNNFATLLQATARELWRDAGVPDSVARQLNASLLNATVENVTQFGPQDALTGPAARGDADVVTSQSEAVALWNAQAGRVYGELSDMAKRLKLKGRST